MRIHYHAILSILFFSQVALGQCPPPGFPDSGNTCPQAPILCENIDGYCNTINNNNVPQSFPGCSGMWQLNNDEWFAFYAGTTTITIVVTPSNCTSNGGNQGMQGGIYNGCGGPVMDVQCSCTTQPFTLTATNYVIGQIYWFVLDGCGGDVCDYSIDVTEGSTVGAPPDDPGAITGPTPVCAGSNGTYAVPVVTGATEYTWTLNPNNAGTMSGGNNQDVNVAWSNNFSGDAELCLMVANACYPNPDTQCYTVHVVPKPTAVLSGSGVLCQGAGGSVDLTVTFTGEAPWVFTPVLNGAPQTPITTSDNPYTLTVNQPGTWTISNVHPEGLGCNGTASGSVVITQVNVVPTSTTVAATCGQSNGSVNLSVTGGNNPYAFNWSNGEITEDLANVPPGTYTVTVTDNNNCTATHTVTVNDDQIVLTPSAVTSPNTVCNASYNGSINLSVAPSGSYTYNWSNGATTEDLINQAPGTYTVTVTSGVNCTATGSYTIDDTPNAPSATFTTVGTTCELANGSINLSVSGGVTPYTFSWSNGATTEDLSNILAGSYAVTVTGANGCTATADITVSNTNPPINITNTVISNTNCNGVGNGSIDVSVSPAGSYTYNWSNGASTQDLSGLLPGTYSLTVTGQGACTASADFTIADMPLEPALSFTVVQTTCELMNGSINVSVSGGVSPYTFVWSNGATTEDLSNLLAGDYMVTVTGANGCTDEANITVGNNNPPITVTANIMGNTTCDGNYNGSVSATASPSGSYTYLWSTGATTTNINNLPAGDYTVTVTGQGACSQVQTFTVPENANVPAVVTSFVQTTCDLSNGSITVTANGSVPPFTFNWSSGQTTQNLTNIPAGSYTVTVTAANGCTTVAEIDVPNFNPPFGVDANVIANTTCTNGNGSIDVTVLPGGNYIYTWSNGASTQDLSNLLPGDYTLTVSAGGTCVEVQTYTIADNPNTPNLSFSSIDANCGLSNGSINLSVSSGVSPFTYIWSNGSTAQDLNNIPAEIYIVTVTGANGCSTVDGVVLSDLVIPVNIEGFVTDQSSCVTNNGAISLVVTPASATILWDNNSSSPTRNNLAPGTYSVTVSAGGTCTETATFEVYDNLEYPVLSTDIVEAYCGILNGSIDLEADFAITPFTYHWSTGAVTQDLANLPQGTYTVTVTSAVGCTTETTVFVPNNDFPIQISPTIYDNLSCVPPLNGAIDLDIAPSGYNYIFKWSNGKTTQNLAGLSPGFYVVTVTLGTSCSTTETIEVLNAAAAPNLSVASMPAICGLSNGGANLSASGGSFPYTYKWSTGATTEDLSNVPPGTYTVTVTDFFDCSATTSVVVTNNNVVLNVSGVVTQNTSCAVGNGALDISVAPAGMYNYNWSNAATTEDISNLPAGIYTVTVTAGTSCISTATYTVLNNTADPVVTPAVTAAICTNPNGEIDLTVGGGLLPYTFVWSNSAITEDLVGLLPGTYSVTVTDANGCMTDTILFVPNNSSTFSLAGATQALTDCAANNGAIDVTVTPAGPYTYLWSTGAVTQDVSALPAGIYTIEVTETGTCTASISFIIPDNRTYPSIAQSISAELCDLQNGSIDLTISGGLMPYAISWSSGQTTEDLTNVSDGTYTVTVVGANNCPGLATAIVPDNSVNFVIAGVPTANTSCVSSNGAVDLTMSPTDPGFGLVYSYSWSNASMTEDIFNLPMGQYVVTVSAGGTCTSTANYNVANNAVAPTITEVVTSALCSQSSGAVDVSINGGQAPYTFLWSNGSILEDLTGVPPGNYSLTVTGANGCTRVKNYVILENVTIPAITPTITTNTSCISNNGGIALNVSPAALVYSYNWAGGQTTSSLQNLPGGSYTVTVSAGGSCIATASFNVQNNVPVVTLSGARTNVLCFGNSTGAIDLTVNGGNLPYTYNWSPAAGNIEDLVNLVAGTYSVTVTDVNGCTSATMFNITQPASSIQIACASINDITNPTATDGKGTVTISGGVAPYTVLWSPGGMQNNVVPGIFNFNNLGQGTFLVTVTDANGCPATCSFVIGLVPCETSVGTMGNNAISLCGTGCITADYSAVGQFLDPNDALQFILHEGSGNQIVNEIMRSSVPTFCFNAATMTYGTTYYISAVAGNADPSGNVIIGAYCSVISAPTPITFYEKPVAATNQPMPLNCVLREINLIGSSNLAGASFAWSTLGGNLVGNVNQANVKADKAGSYSLIIAVNGCKDTASVAVTDISNSPVATILATPDDLLDCVLDEITLSGTVEGSFDANTIWISGGNTYIPGTVLKITDPGTYQFVILDTLTMCSDTAVILINENLVYPPLFLNPPGLLTCLNTAVTLTGGSPFPGISFSWATITGTDTTFVGAGTSLPVATAGTYWLFGIDPANQCTNAADVTVLANQNIPLADAGSGFSIKCFGETANLDGTASSSAGALNFLWTTSNGNFLSGTTSATPLISKPGTYVLLVTDPANGCTDTDNVVIDPIDPTALATVNQPPCYGDRGSILVDEVNGGVPPIQYSLNDGPFTTQNAFLNLEAGPYTVVVQDAEGCSTTLSAVLIEPNEFVIIVSPGVTISLGDSYQITTEINVPLSEIQSIQWTPSTGLSCDACLDPVAAPLVSTQYSVEVKTEVGCRDNGQVRVLVDRRVDVYIPNVFSPNDDGDNDIFTVFADEKGVRKINYLQVYTRWGELIWERYDFDPNDLTQGWDGTHRGKDLNPAVFVYHAELEFIDGRKELFKGDVTIVR